MSEQRLAESETPKTFLRNALTVAALLAVGCGSNKPDVDSASPSEDLTQPLLYTADYDGVLRIRSRVRNRGEDREITVCVTC